MRLAAISAFAVVFAVNVLGCHASRPPDVADAKGCSEVPDDGALASLYTTPIGAVEAVESLSQKHGADEHELEGARFRLRDVKVDEREMARALACHAAGAHVPVIARVAPPFDPVRPPGGKAWVTVTREGADVVVLVTAPRTTVAAEILERGKLLVANARPGDVAAQP